MGLGPTCRMKTRRIRGQRLNITCGFRGSILTKKRIPTITTSGITTRGRVDTLNRTRWDLRAASILTLMSNRARFASSISSASRLRFAVRKSPGCLPRTALSMKWRTKKRSVKTARPKQGGSVFRGLHRGGALSIRMLVKFELTMDLTSQENLDVENGMRVARLANVSTR